MRLNVAHTRLRSALEVANLPTVVMVLHHLTGDEKWLRRPYRPQRSPGMDDLDSGGFPESVQEEIRAAAFDAITAWASGRRPIQVPRPDLSHLHRMAEACMGEDVPVEFTEMIGEQAALLPEAEHRPRPVLTRGGPGPRVGIIGAGVSGLAMARRLSDQGIDCVLFERNSAVGGCWMDNRYPGCGVDTPSYLYSFSFYDHDWSTYFGKRDEVLGYMQDMAREFGLADRVRFEHEVRSAEWCAADSAWRLTVRTPHGEQREVVDFLVSAVGQLNVPSVPSFEGREDFTGPLFHSARWPADLDVTGKRVAVVGNGASAMQIVPAIAGSVESLTIYQRSKQWIAPNADYFRPMDERIHYLMGRVPFYNSWFRARLAWIHNDRVHESLEIDPSWDGGGRSINAINDGHRRYFTAYLERELDGRADLIEATLPDYPPFGKRMLLDNGWFAAIRRDDVELVTEGIERLSENGVVARDGVERKADVVILATGFRARDFLVEIDVAGPKGRLGDVWSDEDARAYLGMAVPGFPNLFVMYGPNTNLGHGGSFITIAECQAHYLGELIAQAAEDGIAEVEVRPEVCAEYNRRVDEAHAGMIWSVDRMSTWYRNARGRVVTNMPWRVMDYWKATRRPERSDYVLRPAGAGVRR
ncbi:FAD dependent oxidoreductase [Mycobacterium tuberculosis]|nr:FAD dependent oxidoreductase [Mycobacterium tuberculosis]